MVKGRCPNCQANIKKDWSCCPYCGKDIPAEVREPDEEELKMYVEYRNGEPHGYLYGPSWKAWQLFMEGGYKTPEEAKAAWEREQQE